jgi:O-antigen biosynthesis protein
MEFSAAHSATPSPDRPIILSVVIPCYNQGEYLLEAIHSVEDCPDQVYEIIIVNDGSTDALTVDLMRHLADQGYIVLNQDNQGLARARNNGIEKAKGRYILALDSDNKILPEYISRGIEILDQYADVGVVYGQPKWFGEAQRTWEIPEQFDPGQLILGNYIDACAVFRKSLWRDCEGYDPHMPVMGLEDWDFWLSAIEKGWKFYYVSEVLYEYRVRADSMVSACSLPENWSRSLRYIYTKHAKLCITCFPQIIEEREVRIGNLQVHIKNLDTYQRSLSEQVSKLEKTVLQQSGSNQQLQDQLLQAQFALETTQSTLTQSALQITSQLHQAHLELERSNAQLKQVQAESDQAQQSIREMFQVSQQKLAQTQHLQMQLDNVYHEGVKGATFRLLKKINLKLKREISRVKQTPALAKLKKLEALLYKTKSKLFSKTDSSALLPNYSLLALSKINQDRFWEILDPIISRSAANVGRGNPQISILTPTWNSSLDWFVETAISVFNQTLPNWEWCIVDDGSHHPEIRAVVEEMARRHPRVTVCLQKTGKGISGATNQALELARGEFICLLDHDDTLAPLAIEVVTREIGKGYDAIYSDEDKIALSGRSYTEPFYKPDWSPEYFNGVMYVGHLLCVRRALALQVGGFRSEFDGVQDYEFMLRISEATSLISHIPKILYHWRKISGSIAATINAKPRIAELQVAAVNAHLERLKLPAQPTAVDSNHRVQLVPQQKITYPLVSIVIPTKNAPEYLGKCLESIFNTTIYPYYEVVLVDNKTTDPIALQIMEKFPVKRVLFPETFNFSRANNIGVSAAKGEYIIFLNNDTEVITPGWIEHLLYYAEQTNVGAVGALLLYPDQTVQHAGVVMGLRGTADHVMRGFPIGIDGYAGSLVCSREVSAVTAACLMLKKTDFEAVGGFNEHFFTHYQDVDLCLQLLKLGKKNIYASQSVLIHHESKTRQASYDIVDRMLLLDLHQHYIDSGDPYYNPNFDIAYFDYTVRAEAC